jgi:hypothetical protein
MADRRIFTVAFSGVAVTAAQDLFEITAPSDRSIELIDVRFGQISDVGDAASEQLAVNIRRGALSGSGGATATPASVNAAGKITGSTAEINNTTAGAGGTVIIVDVWNIMAPYLYRPGVEERITAPAGGRISIGITAPADSLTMYGTATFAEIAP